MSDCLWPQESQHARPPCPSPTSGVHWDSRPSSQWCHPAISSSVVPFSFCLQFFPATGNFLSSQFFTSGGQRIGVSISASVLPINIQGWFTLGLTGWVSLQAKDSQESSPTPQFKSINSSVLSFLHSLPLTSIQIRSDQSLSRVRLFATPWIAARQASLSITNFRSSLRLTSIESVMPSNHLILCHPLLLPWIFPASGSFPVSQFFTSGGQRIGVSASASVLPMNTQDWSPLGWTSKVVIQGTISNNTILHL